MKIKALIAVRSGSVRVEHKNIRAFAGTTLLDIKIRQLLAVNGLDGIVVNSNDEDILNIARKYKVELVKRDDKYASNTVSMSDVYENMAQNIDTDVVMYSNVTNPLMRIDTIEKMIERFREGGDFDSLNSVNSIKQFMYLDGKPINYDPMNQPRSQDLPDIVAINFAISLLSRAHMIEYKNVVGRKPELYTISDIEAVDIDTMLDFKTAEYLYKLEHLML